MATTRYRLEAEIPFRRTGLSEPVTTDSESSRSERKGIHRYAIAVYGQIAGIIGALTIATFLGHFIAFDWRGALAQITGVWDSAVRPTVKVILDAVVIYPCAWLFRWHIAIQIVLRDYISVGIVLFFSGMRIEWKIIWPAYKQLPYDIFTEWCISITDGCIFITKWCLHYIWYTQRRVSLKLALVRELRKSYKLRFLLPALTLLWVRNRGHTLFAWASKLRERRRRSATRRRLRREIRSSYSLRRSWRRRWIFRIGTARYWVLEVPFYYFVWPMLLILYGIFIDVVAVLLMIVVVPAVFVPAFVLTWPISLVLNVLLFTPIGDRIMLSPLTTREIIYRNRPGRIHTVCMTIAPILWLGLMVLVNTILKVAGI